MHERVYITSGVVSVIELSWIHRLTAHTANRNRQTAELSQDLVGELQNHLGDITDLAQIHFKASDHDASANLRSNMITTMVNLLEIHRTLAACEVVSPETRQHSRNQCGELLSSIALTAQKVVVIDGKCLSSFLVVCINEFP